MKKLTILVFTLITIIIFKGQVLKAEEYLNPPSTDAQVEEWGKWIKGNELFGREEGAFKLGVSRNHRAVPYLLEALKDASPTVRQHSARYLGDFGDGSILSELMDALKIETAQNVQAFLIKSMQKMGLSDKDEEEISPYIEKLIVEGYKFIPDINGMKNDKVKKELINKLEKTATTSKNEKARFYAAEKLIYEFNADPNNYENIFSKIMQSQNNKSEKLRAIKLLEKHKMGKKQSLIESALKDSNPEVRSTAEESLKRIRNEK